MQELVSIIVPVYRVEQYLSLCLSSIINQTYKNIEIILIPQPGGDLCEKICREYEKKDERIRVISQEICDLSHARNVGIDYSKGEYIAFIDSDDFIDSTFVECMYSEIKEADADIVQCRSYAFVDEKNIQYKKETTDRDILDGKEMCTSLVYKTYGTDSGVIQTKLYKSDLFADIRFPEGRINEDAAVNYKLYWKSKRIVVTGKKLYYYRSQRRDSITHRTNTKIYADSVINARECCDFYNENNAGFLYDNALYNLSNTIIRARYYIKEQKEYTSLIRVEQSKLLVCILNSNNISRNRKVLSWIGYHFPSLWMLMWYLRNNKNKFIEWKIKGVRK